MKVCAPARLFLQPALWILSRILLYLLKLSIHAKSCSYREKYVLNIVS